MGTKDSSAHSIWPHSAHQDDRSKYFGDRTLGYPRGAINVKLPLSEPPAGGEGTGAANSAISALESTSSIACWASIQTGCAGHHTFLAQDMPEIKQTFRQIGPSMASITSRIDALRPRGEIANPPDGPRRELISLARANACNTFERKLSGAPVASARAGSIARSWTGSFARSTITRMP